MRLVIFALLAVSVFPPRFAQACDGAFREPAVNFAGITTRQQMDDYMGRILWDELGQSQQTRILDCYRAESKAAKTAGNWDLADELSSQHDEESGRWLADFNRFSRQLEAAGKSHLALLASQPVAGMYSGYQSAPNNKAADSRPSPSSQESSSRSVAANSSSSNGNRAYAPWQHCFEAVAATATTPQMIKNLCDQPIEAHWRDTGGGWNQVTIPITSVYRGGYPVAAGWACAANDSFDRQMKKCKH